MFFFPSSDLVLGRVKVAFTPRTLPPVAAAAVVVPVGLVPQPLYQPGPTIPRVVVELLVKVLEVLEQTVVAVSLVVVEVGEEVVAPPERRMN